MPRQTETNSQVNAFQHSPPSQGRIQSRRRSPWRLARSAVMVLGAVTLAGLAVFLFTSTRVKDALASENEPPCSPPFPAPGPARPWEAQVSVSTYSSVNTRNGNVFTAIPIVSWSGRGPDMNMMLYHNSAAVGDDSFAQAVGFNLGPGWSISYSDHLLLNELPNKVTVVAANGTKNVFWWSSSQQRWVPPNGVYDKLSQDAENPGIWKLKHKDLSFHEFSSSLWFRQGDGIARLTRVVDATGSAALLDYDSVGTSPQQKPRLKSVLAGCRYLNFDFLDWAGFEYDFLQTIRDPWDGDESTHERRWTLQYYETDDYDEGWLSRIEDAMQHENRAGWNYFTYDTDGRLVTVSDKCNTFPIGECKEAHLSYPSTLQDKYQYTYTAEGRAYQVFDPLDDGGGLMQQFAFTCSAPRPSERYTITNYTNRRGALWQYRYPEAAPIAVPANAGTLRFVQDPAGTSFYDFDGNFNLLRYADANGNAWQSTYDLLGNRLTLRDPLNHAQSWTYDWLNNVTSHIDAAGNIVWYYYDNPAYPILLTRIVEPCNEAVVGGQPCPTDNPPGGQLPGQEGNFPVTRLTYDSYGQLESVIDPNGVWTGFEYDQWGQQAKYIEGRWESQVAGGGLNYGNWHAMTPGSDGNGTGGSSSGGTGGDGSHDSNGNPTSSTCLELSTAGGAPPNSWPQMTLPCYAPAIPGRSAEFSSATYSPKGELLELPLSLTFVGGRTHRRTYDVMGRPLTVSVESNEAGGTPVTRTFRHSYDAANGTYTRVGPDEVETFVQLDAADRVQSVRRGPATAPLMTATYVYQRNGYVDRITYGNGTRVQYFYEAHRLSSIEHIRVPGTGERLLRLDYEYTVNDLPATITEYGPGMPGAPAQALTTFTYDRRARLTRETRVYYPNLFDPTKNYDLEYVYDKGGNRTLKIDHYNDRRVEYHYDVEAGADPNVYGSLNNRLMWYETIDTTFPSFPQTISKTYYVYTYDSTDLDRAGKTDGNPTRIITEYPAAGGIAADSAASAAASSVEAQGATVGTTVEGGVEATALIAPPPGGPQYSAVRFGYAANGRAVVFAHGETWTGSSGCPSDYQIPWAREFRYDGARARYMNRPLDVSTLGLNPQPHPTQPTVWSDYDGDEAYGDYRVTPGNPPTIEALNQYQPGLWRQLGFYEGYLHNDHLGTLRLTTDSARNEDPLRVYTAFGERVTGPTDRFGYVGAYGYQSTLDGGTEVFPFLHVGARYYDPSSARFLQRDPIGLAGGTNVYAYVGNRPTRRIDPKGHQAGGVPGIPSPPPPYVPPFGGIPDTPGADFYPPQQSTGNIVTDLVNACTTIPGSPITVKIPPPPPPRCPPDCPKLTNPDNNHGPCGSGTGGGAAGGLLVLFALRYRRRSMNPRRSSGTNLTQMTVRLTHRRFQRRGDVLIRRQPIEKR